MFTKILIANRGEIACRIIRTAKRLGIQTIAVYSSVDSNAQHVQQADKAYYIGEAPATDSYLNADAILRIAKEAGAQAVHPGYGFLSENTDFSEACAQAGITFIGPPAPAIAAMGSKRAAKHIMQTAKIPVVPGYHGENQDPEYLEAQAEGIGFPVLLKAAAGGGGKGMRLVHENDNFLEALAAAKREARSSFGDDIMIIEKYLEQPRHIEFQIFADQHGNSVHLFERDCSIQRRHQKIIEETPAVGFNNKLRDQMGKAAIKAAKAINYVGAGTVEFLVDAKQHFYFMEMNTRLQVEHPITEMITGIDLVEWQLRVSSGEALPLAQSNITAKGHAIEVRIYAEDPQQQFLPATGKVIYLETPKENQHIRIDSGVVAGDTVSMYYDPMIAKLIAWGDDRETALRYLQQALQEYHLVGIKNNVAYLQNIITHNEFIRGNTSTHFIDQYHAELSLSLIARNTGFAIASLYCLLKQKSTAWQMNLPAQQSLQFLDENNERLTITVTHHPQGYELAWDDHSVHISGHFTNVRTMQITLEKKQFSATIYEHNNTLSIFALGTVHTVQRFNPAIYYARSEQAGGHLNAPMPGTVVAILAKDGTHVKRGDGLIVLEAMKMEHTINAPSEGTVKKIYFALGDQVDEGAELLSFESAH